MVSGKYTPFDSAEVLQVVEPHLEEYELQRPQVGRDEMVVVATRPEEHDVSTRRVGDIVKTGLTIRNSEVGTMSLGVEFSLWRLKCLNGMICPTAEITVRQRHIWIDRQGFEIQLRNAVANAREIGESMVAQLRGAHQLLLPNLDPDEGKLQREVVKVLRGGGIWTKAMRKEAESALGVTEEASLFGLVQILTGDFARRASLADRIARERTAGRLMALAA